MSSLVRSASFCFSIRPSLPSPEGESPRFLSVSGKPLCCPQRVSAPHPPVFIRCPDKIPCALPHRALSPSRPSPSRLTHLSSLPESRPLKLAAPVPIVTPASCAICRQSTTHPPFPQSEFPSSDQSFPLLLRPYDAPGTSKEADPITTLTPWNDSSPARPLIPSIPTKQRCPPPPKVKQPHRWS